MNLPVRIRFINYFVSYRLPYTFSPDYLDRESLAALTEALKAFDGGVLVITHNRDFSESICKECVK